MSKSQKGRRSRKSQGKAAAQGRLSGGQAKKSTARYLRDTKSGAIASRNVPLTSSRDDIRHSWAQCAALAQDLIQNSGILKGACDQVLSDTIGVGLTLSPQPDLSGLGLSEEQGKAFREAIKKRWRSYANTAAEVDYRGKFNLHELVDISLRWDIAFGEDIGIIDYFPQSVRRQYGITSGTKLLMVPPMQLVQDTREHEGLYQGVLHDSRHRPVAYRFRMSSGGISQTQDFPARDADGRPIVLHNFDPMDATDVRGVSALAPSFRKFIQAENLDDATLQMAVLQTVFAIALTSEQPSKDAFEALTMLEDMGGSVVPDGQAGDGISAASALSGEYMGYLSGQLESAAGSRVDVGADPRVSHLGPGEKLNLETPKVPGGDYLPYRAALMRDVARCLGITYGAFTMDNTDATYSSVLMDNAVVWPVVERRRTRRAVPKYAAVYASWLDEEVGEGRIDFPPGYEVFRQNRARICQSEWHGPMKPTADDYKAARAAGRRLENRTTTLAHEMGQLGVDFETVFAAQLEEHRRYEDAGMASPYAVQSSGSAAPLPVEVSE